MQSSLSEKALAAVKSFYSASETNLGPKLFQYLSHSLKISPFVVDAVNAQCESVLTQLIWHSSHRSIHFREYLHSQLMNVLFESDFCYAQGQLLYLSDFVEQVQSEESIMGILRKLRRCHSAAIAVLELNNDMDIEESMMSMSILAEELTQVAYLWSYAKQQAIFGAPFHGRELSNDSLSSSGSTEENVDKKPPQDIVKQNMIILAMGKLGGFELNFSSDIDLIFFYPLDGETFGGRRKTEVSRFFQKVGVLLIKLLNEATLDGFVFRVDMRLRPYGDSGGLVMSVDQAEDYYHEQGRDWERFAMVRARAITGTVDEKKQLSEVIKPFAYRRYIDYSVIESLRNMKQMIQREVRRRNLKGNIKLGAGGIREIEFMVQSLQLIQGGRDKGLQQRSILKVLPLLAKAKLLPKEISTELAKNYRFLRRLEQCLQELEEKQTQQLPEDKGVQEVIARVMQYSNWQEFKRALNKIQTDSNEYFSALFGEDRNASTPEDDFYLSLWEGHISNQQLSQKLPQLTASDTDQLIIILDEFRSSSLLNKLSDRGAKRLKLFFPSLLAICLSVSNPAVTLKRLLVILKAILQRTAYLDLLSENLPILQHLVDLVSRSDWIVQRLSDSPVLFDELLYPNSLYEPLQTSDLKSELQQSLLRIDENDEEQLLDSIRRFKQINELRVAAALLAERLNISQVSRYLSQLAQVIIQASMRQCWRVLTQKYGEPAGLTTDVVSTNHSICERSGFAVIAYGKLGGGELGFGSDLDLVFLFDQPLNSKTNGIKSIEEQSDNKNSINIERFYTRFAQKLIHFLSTRTSSGVLYEVDMRLRPSGNSGLLVSHIDSFEGYQLETAWTWEYQALVRARPIAGDVQLGKKFARVRKKILELGRDPEKLRNDVLEMRSKMRKELDKSNKTKIDLKQCVGGLVDIEFLSQYLILNGANVEKQEGTVENREGTVEKRDETVEKRDGDAGNNKNNHESLSANSPPSSTVEALKFAELQQQITSDQMFSLIKIYRNYRNYLNEAVIIGGDKLIKLEFFTQERERVKQIWDNVFAVMGDLHQK